MRTILAARTRPDERDPAVRTATALATRTGARMRTVPVSGRDWGPDEAADGGPDSRLVVLSPRAPEGSGLMDLDEAALRVLLRSRSAVLVVRSPAPWGLRRALIPLLGADVERGSLFRAMEWVQRLAPGGVDSGEPGALHVRVMHVSRDPDEMYADTPRLRGRVSRAPAARHRPGM
jgi:hypothetical protein